MKLIGLRWGSWHSLGAGRSKMGGANFSIGQKNLHPLSLANILQSDKSQTFRVDLPNGWDLWSSETIFPTLGF